MNEVTGQPPAPAAPAYQPPPPPPGPVGVPAAQPPKKRKTVLWVVLTVVVLALVACGVGVYLFINTLSGPAKAIEALNAAAKDEDQDEVEKYFDVESVARNAYGVFMDAAMETPDLAELIAQVGEEEARAQMEEYFPEDAFVEQMVAEFDVSDGEEPFPDPEITNTEITNGVATVTLNADMEGETVEWVLRMEKNDGVWQIVEVVNMKDILEEQGAFE